MEFTRIFICVFVIDLVHLGPVLISLLLAIALTGHVIGRLEKWSRIDAFYHAFINATTVGYGDFRPTKDCARDSLSPTHLSASYSPVSSWLRASMPAPRHSDPRSK